MINLISVLLVTVVGLGFGILVALYNAWLMTIAWPWFINYPTPSVFAISGVSAMVHIARPPKPTSITDKNKSTEEHLKDLLHYLLLPHLAILVCYIYHLAM